MTTTLPPLVAAYVQATNQHDAAAFIACFSEQAIVNDAGRMLHGIDAIKAWSDHDIMEALVTLEVLDVTERDGEWTITTLVDGNFDRTGLPDPLIINHTLVAEHNKIVRLTCELAAT